MEPTYYNGQSGALTTTNNGNGITEDQYDEAQGGGWDWWVFLIAGGALLLISSILVLICCYARCRKPSTTAVDQADREAAQRMFDRKRPDRSDSPFVNASIATFGRGTVLKTTGTARPTNVACLFRSEITTRSGQGVQGGQSDRPVLLLSQRSSHPSPRLSTFSIPSPRFTEWDDEDLEEVSS